MGLEKSAWSNESSAAAKTPTSRESFEALDEEGRSPSRAVSLAPVTDCPLPYLEVLLQDASGAAMPGVPCELAFPEGAGKKATTNAEGRAHFPNVDVDASKLMLEIREELAEDGTLSYRAKVVPLQAPESVQGPATSEEPVSLLYPGRDLR
ncbi:hypothetical protein ACLESO_28600 [Pyxidicoccus sp. 3LG]